RAGARGREQLDERPCEARQSADPLREEVCDVRVVAAEELVAAFARERDLYVLGRELRDEVRRKRGRVGERLIECLGERGEEERRVGPQDELAMLRRVPLRDEPRIGELVERALFEADRERAKGLAARFGCERG